MFLTERKLRDVFGKITIIPDEHYAINLNVRSGKEMQI